MAIRSASVSGNWNSTTTWGGAAVPVAADDVIIGAGVAVTVNVTTAAVHSLTIQAGAAATLIFSTFQLNVGGDVSLQGNLIWTLGTTGGLTITASGLITSNGNVIAVPFTRSGAGNTMTLQDTLNVSGLYTTGNATPTQMTAGMGSLMVCSGGITMTTKCQLNAGVTLRITGGTLTGSVTGTNCFSGAGVFEFGGAVTTAANSVNFGGVDILATVNNISGTGTTHFVANTRIIGALTLPNLSVDATLTIALDSPFVITGQLDCLAAAGTYTLTMGGGQTVSVGTLSLTGTRTLNIDRGATGVWTINTINVNSAYSVIRLLGAQDQTVTNFYCSNAGAWFGFVSGQTLTVTGNFKPNGRSSFYSSNPNSIFAVTPGVRFNLNVVGAVVESVYMPYTDVASIGRVIYSPFSPLSNTSGIVNFATNESLQSIRSYGFQG